MSIQEVSEMKNIIEAFASEQLKSEIAATLPEDIPHVFISSFTQEGIKELKDMLWASLQKDIEPEEQAVVLFPGDDNEQVID